MNKPNYELKAKVLQTNFVNLAKQYKLSKFLITDDILLDKVLAEEEQLKKIDYYLEAEKILKATLNRNTRLRSRVASLIEKPSVFVTLTFTDDCLNSTSFDTRRQYVFRFLKTFGVPYVANLDFGSKNGREHYHAIIQVERINPTQWKYGALNVKKIRSSSEPLALAKYISKLTNHAIKETTKRSAIIYSRD